MAVENSETENQRSHILIKNILLLVKMPGRENV